MPDLNLQDDGAMDNLDSSAQPGEETTGADEEGSKKKGGLTTALIIGFAVLIVGGGGAFLLDKLGVVQIFSKKKAAPAVAQLQDQAAPSEAQTGDTGQAQMIDTPPVDEKGAPGAKMGSEKAAVKPTAKDRAQAAMKEMPAPAAAGKLQDMKGEYTIQVSAWRDKELAEEIARRLADAAYPSFVEERAFNGGSWYTVRVGRYPSRKDAELAVQSFAEELKSNYWIDKARSK